MCVRIDKFHAAKVAFLEKRGKIKGKRPKTSRIIKVPHQAYRCSIMSNSRIIEVPNRIPTNDPCCKLCQRVYLDYLLSHGKLSKGFELLESCYRLDLH
jgi:hypothetical protein